MYYKTQLCREYAETGVCEQTQVRVKREEEDLLVALSTLLATNQRLAEDSSLLKAKVEAATVKLHTLRQLVSCHACLKTEKAALMPCGHIVCVECSAAGSCQVCFQPGSPVCRVFL